MPEFFNAKFRPNCVVRNVVISTEFHVPWNSEPQKSAEREFRGTKFLRNNTGLRDKLRRNSAGQPDFFNSFVILTMIFVC